MTGSSPQPRFCTTPRWLRGIPRLERPARQSGDKDGNPGKASAGRGEWMGVVGVFAYSSTCTRGDVLLATSAEALAGCQSPSEWPSGLGLRVVEPGGNLSWGFVVPQQRTLGHNSPLSLQTVGFDQFTNSATPNDADTGGDRILDGDEGIG